MLLCLQKETEWGVIEELLYFSQDERLRLQGKQKKDAKSDKMKSVGKERIPNQPLLIILQSMLLFNAEFLDSVEVYFWWWPLEFVGTWSKPLYTIILPVSSNPSTLFKSCNTLLVPPEKLVPPCGFGRYLLNQYFRHTEARPKRFGS